jgi:hypothetical protein
VVKYGIRSYIGEPLRLGNSVIGALCAIDVSERHFSDADRAAMNELAARVNHRLNALSSQSTHATPAATAGEELSLASRLVARALDTLQVGLADLAPLVRISAHDQGASAALPLLEGARAALGDCTGALEALVEANGRLGVLSDRLATLGSDERAQATVSAVTELAGRLADYATAPIGGVAWTIDAPQAILTAGKVWAATVTSVALSLVAHHARTEGSGIFVHASLQSKKVVIELSARSLDPSATKECAARLEAILQKDPHISTEVKGSSLRLHLLIA